MTSRNPSAGEPPAHEIDSTYEDRAEIGAVPTAPAAALTEAIVAHLTDPRRSIRNAATLALLTGDVVGLIKVLPHEAAEEIGKLAMEVYNEQR